MARDPSLPHVRSRRRPSLTLAALALFALAAPALPQGDVPRELRPWIPWVLAEHPELGCPLVAGERLCAWPGRLELRLDDRGGRFSLDVQADRELDLPLPGDAATWPQEVTDYGGAALMRRRGEQPAVRLAPGRHRLAGRFVWSRLPESLPVPRSIALVELTVRGRAVPRPRREAGGLLWLDGAQAEEAAEDRLDLEVQRRIDDGVPVLLTLRLALRVAGQGREVDLGRPLPEGFEPISLVGGLPARLGESGELLVQLRPGEWELQLSARSAGPILDLGLDERPDPWPREEIWAFQADLATRSVKISGAPAIDPQRTSLPDAWRGLPAFRLAQGSALAFTELRRGEAEPPPDAITLNRSWWLAEDGRRFTVQDRLAGTLHRGGRLAALAPAELGRAALDEDGAAVDQVITVGPGDGTDRGTAAAPSAAGVEVRRGELRLAADLTYPRGGPLPAVGWNRDVQSLGATLHLPPGWTLLAAPGADRAGGAWVDRWSLLDLFFLLILGLATWKLDGPRWGLVALALLGAGWHEPHAGALWAWWIALVPLRALVRVLPKGRASRFFAAAIVAVSIGFAIQLLVFCASQFRTGLFPQLEEGGRGPYERRYETQYLRMEPAADEELLALGDVNGEPAEPEAPQEQKAKQALQASRRQQVDPEAVVQTGPGVPRWGWTTCRLEWSGPVAAGHQLRLWLLSPLLELVLSWLRIAAVVAIAWRIFGRVFRRFRGHAPPESGGAAAGGAPALLFLAAATFLAPATLRAQEPATPPSDILAELERRLTAPPDCHPDCLEVPRLALEARADELLITAAVHAASTGAWRLPGPADAWSPSRVSVDGSRVTDRLRRGTDGFLMLRLTPGTHRVELRGPAEESVSLQFPLRPRAFSWRGAGWTIAGYRADAPPPASIRLDRQQSLAPVGRTPEDRRGDADAAVEPWLELTRVLDVGILWQLHNELRRHGPSGPPVRVRVPLLAGESVTTPGIAVDGGEAEIALERGETVRRWRSSLEEAESFTLIAPADRPWLERWELDCSPIWSCRAEGLAPMRHMADDVWRPRWQPWPGEGLTFRFARPPAAAGETATIDAAELTLTPGRRLRQGRLQLDLRSSRGGEHRIALPGDATLQSFAVDDLPQPVQAVDGRLAFTVEPGRHRVVAEWRQPHRLGLIERSPAVELDGAAVNVRVTVEVPENRWLLWAGGPAWGPVVTMWEYLLILVLAAWALGRFAPTPLAGIDWLLLGAGMTQVPLLAPVLVVLWLLALAFRDRLLPRRRWWSYDLRQLAFLALSVAALVSLYAAIHAGLLVQPDVQVAGAGSYGSVLNWYADRADGTLPQPWILWLPLWVWRVLMLLWSLWLASRLLRWLPWCWERFAIGPLWVGPKSFRQFVNGGESETAGEPETAGD